MSADAMNAVGPSLGELREHVNAFLLHEADLVDQHRYDDWLGLWASDAIYWVPCNEDDYDPTQHVSIIYDDYGRLEERCFRLNSEAAHSQDPPSRLCRIIGNQQVSRGDAGDVPARRTSTARGWSTRCTPRGTRSRSSGRRLSCLTTTSLSATSPSSCRPAAVIREGSVVVSNEFASVEIRVDQHANGSSAWVTDRRSGVSRRIDPLALEGLVWVPEHIIASLADPGFRT